MSTTVSVVIPNYNGRSLLKTNLPKVMRASPHAEVIVVDDASTDDSVAVLTETFPTVKILQHPSNRRFAAACNSGITAATGDVVILLNTDVTPQHGYLDVLLPHFEDKTVFSVGCREFEQLPTHTPQTVLRHPNPYDVMSGRTEGAFRRGLWVHWRPTDQESTDTFWTFGGSMAVDRRKYLALKGMDELFAPAYWEDVDLCYRAKQKGWKVLFDAQAVVYHVHETTNASVFGKRRMQQIAYRNQLLFTWKHMTGRQWLEHLFWLPYHLALTAIRSKGSFLVAFLLAVHRWVTYDS